ncbi:extracellular solute-binding protein [Paenibacillus beijingensis]|uniref:ABC transporter substrate-binding protein n=1 Tax=Paenibacillus beijingensis TaxID=1126833 RepID=A0A0D5NIQ0_9BACL|nr:extracellular solute-binding protein [Paenibacillus beijingensis]AJY75131.1 ABC transporter substrate-binding protein [Paenibacillus beijingensis]
MKSKKQVKRLSWTAVSLLLAASLAAGCGQSGSAPAETAASEQKDASASASGVTEISFVSYSNYEKPLKKVIEAFEAGHPDVKVKLELNPFAQMMETIEIKMGSKSKDMDLLFVDSPLVMNYAVKGYLEPLDKLLPEGAKQTWVQSAVDAASYQNQLMAAPMNNSSQVMYYNKDLFQKAGVPFPDEDKRMTWEEVRDLAKKLTQDTNGDGQNDLFGFSFDQVGRAYQLLALSEGLGAKMISEDGMVSSGYTNSPEAVKAFQFYADLFNKDKVSPKIKKEESIDYFTSGKVAMFVGANHNLPKLKAAGLNFGVTLHPYFAGQKIVTPTGAWNVGISKYSANKEAAAEFIQFLTVGEGAKIMFVEGGTLPPQVDLLDEIGSNPKYGQFPDNVIRIAARESRETAVPRPQTPGYLEWESNMNKAFEDMKNGTDPKKALDDAVNIIDNQLKKYKQ